MISVRLQAEPEYSEIQMVDGFRRESESFKNDAR
jgi:hypothetical protein